MDNSTGLVVNYIQSIFSFMPNLNKLTLSIRNTNDPLFCHGTNFESILSKSLPNLRQFNYTMTHQINENTIIENFIRWRMSIVNYEKYVHIYSLPWPSSRDDQRELPTTSDMNIRLPISSSIEMKFSSRITRLILNKETRKKISIVFQVNKIVFFVSCWFNEFD